MVCFMARFPAAPLATTSAAPQVGLGASTTQAIRLPLEPKTLSVVRSAGMRICTMAVLLRPLSKLARRRKFRVHRQKGQRIGQHVSRGCRVRLSAVLTGEDQSVAVRRAEELVAEVLAELPADSPVATGARSLMQESFYCDLNVLQGLDPSVSENMRKQAEAMVDAMLQEKVRKFKCGGVLPAKEQLVSKHYEDAKVTPVARGGSSPDSPVFRFVADQMSMQHVCTTDVAELQPVLIADLKPYQIAHGRALRLTTVTEPLNWSGPIVVVEDADGTCVRLSLYPTGSNQWALEQLQRFLPKGSSIAIREPYMTICADGTLGLRVDNVETNVVIARPGRGGEFADGSVLDCTPVQPDPAVLRIVETLSQRTSECDTYFSKQVASMRESLRFAKHLLVVAQDALQAAAGEELDVALTRSASPSGDPDASDFMLTFQQSRSSIEPTWFEHVAKSLQSGDQLSEVNVAASDSRARVVSPAGEKYDIVPGSAGGAQTISLQGADWQNFPSFLSTEDPERATKLVRSCLRRDARAAEAATALTWAFLGVQNCLPGFLINHHVRHLSKLIPASTDDSDSGLAIFWAALADYAACSAFPSAVPSSCCLSLLAADLQKNSNLTVENKLELESSVRQMALHAATLQAPWLEEDRVLRASRGALRRFGPVAVALSLGDLDTACSLLQEAKDMNYDKATGETGAMFVAASAHAELQVMQRRKLHADSSGPS